MSSEPPSLADAEAYVDLVTLTFDLSAVTKFEDFTVTRSLVIAHLLSEHCVYVTLTFDLGP